MSFSEARPWTVNFRHKYQKLPVMYIEGDIMTLDDMFRDLPDNHPSEAYDSSRSHGSIATINEWLKACYGFADTRSYEEMKAHVSVAGRDDLTKLVTAHLASPAMREAITMHGRQRATRPRVLMGDEGEELDLDRLRLGEDDTAWRRTVFQEVERKSRTIILDVQVDLNCSIEAKKATWNGVQAAVIVDALEAEGYRVEVNALQVYSLGTAYGLNPAGGKACVRVRIKRAEDSLRLDLLAYQLGCAALERAALWRCCHVAPAEWSILGYGIIDMHGSAVRAVAHMCAPDGAKPDHILPIALSEKEALEHIREVMVTYQPVPVDKP
jgi:hypothetical protein